MERPKGPSNHEVFGGVYRELGFRTPKSYES